jgi:predicted dehydrogenase
MAIWMAGEVVEVSAQSATFVAERADPEKPGTMRSVTIDDASSALLHFAAGPRGVLEMARNCVRRPCDFNIEVNGSKGTLRFDYARLNELQYGDSSDAAGLYGMRRIRAEHSSHPYASSWWPIGQGVGYGSSFVNQFADLLQAWPVGPWDPDFRQGLIVQGVCDAIERAASERRWVRVEEVASL